MKLGKIQFSDGTLLNNVLDGYSGGGSDGYRYLPIDGYTVVNWKLNESAEPFLNSGTAGTLSLTKGDSNSPTTRIWGVADYCCMCNASNSSYLKTSATSVGEVAGDQFTASLWVKLKSYTSLSGILIKNYRSDDAWSDPYYSLYMIQHATTNSIAIGLNINGTRYATLIAGTYKDTEFNKWIHLAVTYNGTTVTFYKNGFIAEAKSATGNIDWGTHGSWWIMCKSDGVISTGYVEDIRIESVARSHDYIKQMYKTGVGLI